MKMEIIRDLPALRARVAGWRRAGDKVGVVPTMGALHHGHLSLAKAAREDCNRVIVTIFVNPKQFNNPEDLARYPRTEESDAAMLAPLGVDVIYVPDAGDVYPSGFSTTVTVGSLSEPMEGVFRPGHFEGVATVVAKLFLMTQADRAYFGEKDYQQLLVVRRMARDLNIPVEVIGCPTVRDEDGLAQSSRNARLTSRERAIAPALHAAMEKAARDIRGGSEIAAALETAHREIASAGFSNIEYLDLRDSETLAPVERLDRPCRLLAAAWL
ncbi:MAG: pantoate--beta-alanine ligase, partial [Nitratireductor sp.]|nr:pantoate--beta-alanine ligase [Nitratireductor sp.]